MKNNVFYPIIVSVSLLIFISSCSKTDLDTLKEPLNNVDMALITEVENLPNSVVALGYTNLNSEEKVIFWQRHVDRYLKEHPDLEPALKSHIIELRKFAKTEIWDRNSEPAMRKYIDSFERKWFVEPIKKGIFPGRILVEVSSLKGAGKFERTLTNLERASLDDDEERDCDCYYEISCLIGGETCIDKTECAAGEPNNPGNCGVFGTSRCTGRCE